MSSVIYYWTDAGVHEISWLDKPFSIIIIIIIFFKFILLQKKKQNKKRHQF